MPQDYDYSHENHPVLFKREGKLLARGQREFHYFCSLCEVEYVSLKWSTGAMELLWKEIDELKSQVEYLTQVIEAMRKNDH